MHSMASVNAFCLRFAEHRGTRGYAIGRASFDVYPRCPARRRSGAGCLWPNQEQPDV